MDESTFSSITSPWKDPDSVQSQVGDIKLSLPVLLERYLPWVHRIPLNQGITWTPTWKALPTFPLIPWAFGASFKHVRSCFPAFMFELASYTSALMLVHARGEQWSSGILWPSRVRFARDSNNKFGFGFGLFIKVYWSSPTHV